MKIEIESSELADLRAQLAAQKATLAMVAARLGGRVEGRPTGTHNIFQRVDALVATEAELATEKAKSAKRKPTNENAADMLIDYAAEAAARRAELAAQKANNAGLDKDYSVLLKQSNAFEVDSIELASLKAAVGKRKPTPDEVATGLAGPYGGPPNAKMVANAIDRRDIEHEIEVRQLRGALENAKARCMCKGTGKFVAYCRLCGDSTFDHVCEDDGPLADCTRRSCVEARAALAASSPSERLPKIVEALRMAETEITRSVGWPSCDADTAVVARIEKALALLGEKATP